MNKYQNAQDERLKLEAELEDAKMEAQMPKMPSHAELMDYFRNKRAPVSLECMSEEDRKLAVKSHVVVKKLCSFCDEEMEPTNEHMIRGGNTVCPDCFSIHNKAADARGEDR